MTKTPKKRRWPALLLGGVALALLAWSAFGRDESALSPVDALTEPLFASLYWVREGVADIWYGYLYFVDLREHAADLETENRHLRLQLTQLRAQESENVQLRRLLGVKRYRPMRYLAARVVAQDILGEFRTIVINQGAEAGVKKGAPVVDAQGVVGRVVALTDNSARVLLMIDPNSSIDGRITRTRAQGIVQGTSDRHEMLCQFAFSLRTEDLRQGDEVVTSGLDQRFPAGLKLGVVESVAKNEFGIFQEARIRPAADFSRLDVVLVILSEHEEGP